MRLKQLLPQYATARRNGRWQTLLSTELVPGEMVRLQSGDKVPADLRLVSTRELRIDESMLTGESTVVEKGVDPVDESAVVADRACMAYSGTMVTDGIAEGVVVATAQETEIGRISSMMRGVPVLRTPLLRKMARFSRWLSFIILICAVGDLRLWYGRQRVFSGGYVRGGGRPGSSRDSRRSAGHHDHNLGHRRQTHGTA